MLFGSGARGEHRFVRHPARAPGGHLRRGASRLFQPRDGEIFFGARHLVELLDIELAAADAGIAATVMTTRAHLKKYRMPVGIGLRNEAQLFHRILGEHVADIDQTFPRSRSAHHIAVRTSRGGTPGGVGHVDQWVGDGDRFTSKGSLELGQPCRARSAIQHF